MFYIHLSELSFLGTLISRNSHFLELLQRLAGLKRTAYPSVLVALSLMNLLRCSVVLIIGLLSACDAQETPVPKPRTESAVQTPEPAPATPEVRSTAEQPSESVVSPGPEKKSAPVHELPPSAPVVPVVAGKQPVEKDNAIGSAKTPAGGAVAEKKTAQAKPATKRETAAQQRKAKKDAKEAVKNVRLAPPKLDLSLPPELVQEMEPPAKVIPARRKPILPPMFDTNGSSGAGPFELNGRLLSNEMQLQMRNDSRRDVEGAALDFKFKQ